MSKKKILQPKKQTTSNKPKEEDVPFDVDTTEIRKTRIAQQRSDKGVRKQLKRPDITSVASLEDLLKVLGIQSTEWDYLIVGDGSGTVWDKELGWGSVLIAKSDGSRKAFYGGMSNGTNNVAELMVVLHPLMYLANNINWADRPQGLKVHVVSDSEYVANNLNKDNPIWVSNLSLNRELWMAIHMTRRRGINIYGHHINRDTIELNRLGHDLANVCRKKQIGVLTEVSRTIVNSNPSIKNGQLEPNTEPEPSGEHTKATGDASTRSDTDQGGR